MHLKVRDVATLRHEMAVACLLCLCVRSDYRLTNFSHAGPLLDFGKRAKKVVKMERTRRGRKAGYRGMREMGRKKGGE